jgi:hypothetical protein
MGYIIFFIVGVITLTCVLNSCEHKVPTQQEIEIKSLESRIDSLERCIAWGNVDSPDCPQIELE